MRLGRCHEYPGPPEAYIRQGPLKSRWRCLTTWHSARVLHRLFLAFKPRSVGAVERIVTTSWSGLVVSLICSSKARRNA
jgi:hypothetical protein